MRQEDKELFLKDLSARLSYDLFVEWYDGQIENISLKKHCLPPAIITNAKMYLRPMSSMTEEEKNELKIVACPNGTGYFNEQYLVCPVNHFGEQISFDFMADIIDWLNAHHFDYRGLIKKGLALEAPYGMYKDK